MPNIDLWKVFVSLGVPGLALGVFYMLFRTFSFDFPAVPSKWVGPIIVLFMLLTSSVTFYALSLWSPSPLDKTTSTPNDYIEIIRRQLRPVYFDLSNLGPLTADNGDPFGRRSDLDMEGIAKLDQYVELLKELNISYTLLIEGHTSRHMRANNIRLAVTFRFILG